MSDTCPVCGRHQDCCAEADRLRNAADLLRIACEGIVERSPDEAHHIARGALIAVEAMLR